MKGKSFFLSFVEEGVMNPAYAGYVGGRVEVYDNGTDEYAIGEIRFLTKKLKEYDRLRGRYDFEDVTAKELARLRAKIIALNASETQ
jgi:hypothetical protein